jgi:hypothetical protein
MFDLATVVANNQREAETRIFKKLTTVPVLTTEEWNREQKEREELRKLARLDGQGVNS